MDERIFYIYKIECTANGKKYIGRTQHLNNRFQWHLSALRSNRHYIADMQNDFNQYGFKSFRFSIIEKTNGNEVNNRDGSRERYWMQRLRTYDANYGYNSNDPRYNKKSCGHREGRGGRRTV